MSVIAYRWLELEKLVVTDRQGTFGSLRSLTDKGVWHGDTLLVGAGVTSAVNQAVVWYRSGADPAAYPKAMSDGDGSILLAFPRKGLPLLYTSAPYPDPVLESFFAWGSGSELAIGAMAHGADPVEAVRIACRFDSRCGMGIVRHDLTSGRSAFLGLDAEPCS